MRRIAFVVLLATLGACEGGAGKAEGAPLAQPNPLNVAFNAEKATRWMDDNGMRFDSTSVSEEVLSRLLASVDDRRIVMLGGSELEWAEYVRIKVALVRALHERGDFNVLAIDGPVWECTPLLNPAVRYDDSLGESCTLADDRRSEEMDALFEYVVSTHATKRPLELVGLDVQRAPSPAAALRPAVWSSLAPSIGAKRAREIFRLDSMLYEKNQGASQALARERFGTRPIRNASDSGSMSTADATMYDSIALWFSTAAAASGLDDAQRARLSLAAAAARSSAYVVRSLSRKPPLWSNHRESIVVENLLFVADTLYPAQKIIVWSQNRRVHHAPVLQTASTSQASMGALVSARRPEYRPFSLGLFTSHRLSRRKPAAVLSSGSANLAELMHDPAGRSTYLDVEAGLRDSAAAFLRMLDVPPEDHMTPPIALRHAYDAVIAIAQYSRIKSREREPASRCCPARVPARLASGR
jgi:erythromycin esterase